MAALQRLRSALHDFFTSNPQLLTPSAIETPKPGSLRDGSTLQHIPCASNSENSSPAQACTRKGTLSCSKCRLVKYCSQECQRVHWKVHKIDCNSPHASSTWQPTWVSENRDPAFMSQVAPRVSFGRTDQYLWGNTPAMDILNIPLNEGESAMKRDFNICFAASGDIRNLVTTLNGLPSTYEGQCNIILNDFSPYISIRNLILLIILLDSKLTAEEAAELAFHISYSAMLTPHQALYLLQWAIHFFGTGWDESYVASSQFSINSSHVRFVFPRDTLKLALEMICSRYTADTARKNMTDITLAPSRLDYRDRYWACLRPSHRLADIRFRNDGVALPFGASRVHFSEPNRFMFSEKGEWLSADRSSPLEGWDLKAAVASGAAVKVSPEDIFGCFFIHVKGQFLEFARRVRTLKVHLFLLSMDARVLCKFITENPGHHLPSSTMDRIATSNVMDTLPLQSIISDWAPLLNRRNPKATLLAYSMNWFGKEPGGAPETAGLKALSSAIQKASRYLGPPGPGVPEKLYIILMNMSLPAFHDSGPSFEQYLRKLRVAEEARKHGVRRRTKHSIHAPTLGSTLSNPKRQPSELSKDEFYYIDIHLTWSMRYLEFEPDI